MGTVLPGAMLFVGYFIFSSLRFPFQSSVLDVCITLHDSTRALEFLAAQVREILILVNVEMLLFIYRGTSVNRSVNLGSAIEVRVCKLRAACSFEGKVAGGKPYV